MSFTSISPPPFPPNLHAPSHHCHHDATKHEGKAHGVERKRRRGGREGGVGGGRGREGERGGGRERERGGKGGIEGLLSN